MGWGALFFSIVVWFKVFEEMSLLLFEVLALLLVAGAGFVELDIFVCRHGIIVLKIDAGRPWLLHGF